MIALGAQADLDSATFTEVLFKAVVILTQLHYLIGHWLPYTLYSIISFSICQYPSHFPLPGAEKLAQIMPILDQ